MPILLEKIPFFFLSIALSIVTIVAQRGSAVSLKNLPFQIRIANALNSYVIYLQKTIFPHNLAVLYPYPDAISVGQVSGAAFALGGITLLAVLHREHFPWLVVGWFWYLGTLVPVIGLVQVGIQAFADRYTYIPLIGIFMIASWGSTEFFRNWRYKKIVLAAAAIVIFPVLTIIAKIQTSYWRDSITLFEHTLQVTEGNYYIHNNLGREFVLQKQYKKALAQYHKSLQINQNFEFAILNYGYVLFLLGKTEESFAYYEEVLRKNPSFYNIHFKFAELLFQTSYYDKATFHFKEALRLNPNFAAACNGLGVVMLHKGNIKQAIVLFREALKIDPEFAEAKMQLKNISDRLQ